MARKTLTDTGVEKLKPKSKRYSHPDPELAGFYIRVQPSGHKSYIGFVRGPGGGKQQLITIGTADTLPIAEARARARVAMQRVRDGLPAFEAPAMSFGAVTANYLTIYAEPNELRMLGEMRRLLNAHILPAWRDRDITSIGKSAITDLLDKVQKRHGARQADHVLAVARMIMRWHSARTDDYRPPLFTGMKRQNAKKQRRARTLDDQEIRAVWIAAATLGMYGAMVRFLLLTGQRLEKVQTAAWPDLLDSRRIWKIRSESPREKNHGGLLKLPPLAHALVADLPVFAKNPFVFAGRKGYFNGLSKAKAQLDEASGVTGWTLHDLRRTARTLMPRAGITPDLAERVLGHALPGVRGVYDQYGYVEEKAEALAKLAVLIEEIIQPGPKLAAERAA